MASKARRRIDKHITAVFSALVLWRTCNLDADAGVTAQPQDVLPIFHLTSCVPLALTGGCLVWFVFAVTLKFDFSKKYHSSIFNKMFG